LDQLFNCTFPHVLKNDSFIWCDQGKLKFLLKLESFNISIILGALCVYEGINDTLWSNSSDLSMLKKVAQVNGLLLEFFFKIFVSKCYL